MGRILPSHPPYDGNVNAIATPSEDGLGTSSSSNNNNTTTTTVVSSEPTTFGGIPTTTTTTTDSVVIPRHAGQVHIRGRIRRVWRPRHLELMSNGRLHYYECNHISSNNNSSNTNNTKSNNKSKLKKVTLLVTSARLLVSDGSTSTLTGSSSNTNNTNNNNNNTSNATNLSDLHTGLLRGSFGFLVRGQRCVDDDAAPDTTSTAKTAPDNDANMEEAAAAGTILHDTGGGVGSLDASFFLANAEDDTDKTIAVPPMPLPVRDYLCAVPTLEEAQMWVVALQWAASAMELTSSSSSFSPPPQPTPPQPAISLAREEIDDEEEVVTLKETQSSEQHWWKIDYFTKATPTTSPTDAAAANPTASAAAVVATPTLDRLNGTKACGASATTTAPRQLPDPNCNKRHGGNEPLASTLSGATTSSSSTPTAIGGSGKILVTAVSDYTIVRWTTNGTWDIVYDIHAVLLYNNSNNEQQTTVAEHWMVRRSAAQLQDLALDLSRQQQPDDDDNSTSKSTSIDSSSANACGLDSRIIRQLPRWEDRPTVEQVVKSLSIVDSLMRSWVMSSQLVNTRAFGEFLGLPDVATTTLTPTGSVPGIHNPAVGRRSSTAPGTVRWYQAPLFQPFSVTERQIPHSVPTGVKMEQYAKNWLNQVRGDGRSNKCGRATSSSMGGLNTNYPWGVLRHPQDWILTLRHNRTKYLIYLGGAFAVGSVLPAMVSAWQRNMPVVPLRLDILVASWAGAAYAGHWMISQYFTNDASKTPKTTSHSADKKNNRGVQINATTRSGKKGLVRALRKSSFEKLPLLFDPNATKVGPPLSRSQSANNSLESLDESAVLVRTDDSKDDDFADFVSTDSQDVNEVDEEDDGDDESDGELADEMEDGGIDGDELLSSMDLNDSVLSSPLPQYPNNNSMSCWSPSPHDIFRVRGANYFVDKLKVPSGPGPLRCLGVDIWLTDSPERHIARHPAVLGGKLNQQDTFMVNFLLPFGNFVSYFAIPPLNEFSDKLRTVWTKFLKGDQEYRDARLKLLPAVVEGPWIVKTAVGPGKSPALLGKVIPLQYFFKEPEGNRKGAYEVDVIISASTIAKSILSIVKSQTKSVTIAFAFIIEAAEQSELPETVLCSFQVHSLHLENCPRLPAFDMDGV